MKRFSIIILSVVLFTTQLNCQVFNTAHTLKKGSFAIGIEPAFIFDADQFYLFLHGGYGIKKGIDMALKFGIGPTNYIGADLEFSLQKNVSLAVGAHSFGDFGLDGTLLFNIPVRSDIKIVSGLDMDINFGNEVYLPLWLPIGLEISLNKRAALMFEVEIGLTDPAYHMFGGGVNFFF